MITTFPCHLISKFIVSSRSQYKKVGVQFEYSIDITRIIKTWLEVIKFQNIEKAIHLRNKYSNEKLSFQTEF